MSTKHVKLEEDCTQCPAKGYCDNNSSEKSCKEIFTDWLDDEAKKSHEEYVSSFIGDREEDEEGEEEEECYIDDGYDTYEECDDIPF